MIIANAIATAPRDGTTIILLELRRGEWAYAALGRFDVGEPGWVNVDTGAPVVATHWLPLPRPSVPDEAIFLLGNGPGF